MATAAKLLEVSVRNATQAKLDLLKQMERNNPEERLERTLKRMQQDFRLTDYPCPSDGIERLQPRRGAGDLAGTVAINP